MDGIKRHCPDHYDAHGSAASERVVNRHNRYIHMLMRSDWEKCPVERMAISLTNKGSGSGAVTLLFSGLPVPAMAGTAIVSDLMNMVVLTSSVDAYLPASLSEIFLSQTGATGSVALADTNISNSSAFTFVLSYQST